MKVNKNSVIVRILYEQVVLAGSFPHIYAISIPLEGKHPQRECEDEDLLFFQTESLHSTR